MLLLLLPVMLAFKSSECSSAWQARLVHTNITISPTGTPLGVCTTYVSYRRVVLYRIYIHPLRLRYVKGGGRALWRTGHKPTGGRKTHRYKTGGRAQT